MPQNPAKLFYKIQEVSEIVGVEPYVLRYWETKFPMVAPEKDGSDQRRYRQRDIEILLRVRSLLYDDKYTIAGAVERLKEELAKGGSPLPPPPAPTGRPGLAEPSDLFEAQANEFGDGADPEPPPPSVDLDKLRRLKAELGMLKRELMQWRDELDRDAGKA